MKRILLMTMAWMMALPLIAQVDAEAREQHFRRYMGIGLKGGVFMPEYFYGSNSDLNDLGKDTLLLNRLRPVVGVQFEMPVGESSYFAAELMWIQKGDARLFHNVPSDDSLRYVARVNYLDLRIPFVYTLPIKGPVRPYVFCGIETSMVMPCFYLDTIPLLNKPLSNPIELNLSGNIAMEDQSVEVNKSNMAPFDAGVFVGLGARYTVDFARFSLAFKLEVAYSRGLLNTFSKKELASEAPAANLGAGGTHYSVDSRFNRGLECTLGVVLPLHFLGGDACSNWSKEEPRSRSRVHRGF
ncbi:MAG: PorT family protein [Bacteroidales bacterium]|nr:PorT family protein [Bacteroidales bacterium]